MSLTGCYAVLQFLVFFMNLIFWVVGLLIITLAVWMVLDPTFDISMAQDESSYYSGICILLLVGALLFIVGFIGCIGAYKESKKMLILFFCGLLLILVAQISAGIWAYSNSDKLYELLKYTVTKTAQDEYGKVDHRTATFDSIQEGLKCCGIYGPSNWAGSNWQNESSHNVKYTVSEVQEYRIPESCCNKLYTDIECKQATHVNARMKISHVIFPDGCLEKLTETLKDRMNTVIIFTICIGIVEFFGIITSLILCCAIEAVNKYK